MSEDKKLALKFIFWVLVMLLGLYAGVTERQAIFETRDAVRRQVNQNDR